MIYLIVVFSLLLEGIWSLLVPTQSVFSSLFPLISLIFIYPLFKVHNHSYFKTCFIVGLFYDVIYTNTLLFHALLFLCIGYLNSILSHFFSQKRWNLFFVIFPLIICYRLIGYIWLFCIGKIPFSNMLLWNLIFSSFLSNLIYGFVLYMLLYRKNQKIDKKRR